MTINKDIQSRKYVKGSCNFAKDLVNIQFREETEQNFKEKSSEKMRGEQMEWKKIL